MARDDKRGRVTPKKGAQPPPSPARRPIAPRRIGPFSRPDSSSPPGQVGRRPSSPRLLALYSAVYLVCGIGAFLKVHGSFGVILGIVFCGLALLWLRGAATAQLRRNKRADDE